MNIGSVFLTLLADGSKLAPQVQKEAEKAGDAGAKTLGQKLAGGLRTEGVKVFGAVASAAFGLATKGALELENATARFRAETSASADEAAAAGKLINKVAGDERMSLEAVSDVAIKVRRDLGATGDEANTLTADIARFARVTRQEGGAAVSDIDDLVDAWGMTLADVRPLLDKLVVSGQKWGGSIEADQKALAAMAPQLKAFNLGIDDGIALLDLFKASGLDAATIPRALNSAIQKLDGRPLQDFIAELASIEDPGERAQRAIEVFGARAGAQLANAIKPGMTSLEDFKITTEEAVGAVDKAADELDGTISGRISKFFSQVGAGVRGFGADFGAAATAIASVGSLLATVGGGKLFKGLAAGLLKPFAGIGIRIATTIAEQLAASTVASRIGDGLASAVNKVPGVASLKTGLGKVGGFMGSTVGKAMGIAAGAAFVLWLADEIKKRQEEAAAKIASIGDSVGAQIASGTDAQLQQSQAALKTGIDALVATTKRGFLQMATPEQLTALQGLVDQYNAVTTELNRRAALNAAVTESQLRAARPGVASATRDLVGEIPTGMQKSAAMIAAAAREFLAKPIGEQLRLIGPMGLRAGADLALNVASGLRSARDAVTSAMAQLRSDIDNAMSPKKVIRRDVGGLISKDLVRGLKSSDPIVKKQAEGTRGLLEAELLATIQAGGKAGKKAQEELERGLKSKDPAVKAQAQRTKSLIDNALEAQPAKSPGNAIGDQLNKDLKSQDTALGRTAYNLGKTIYDNLFRGATGKKAPLPSGAAGGKRGSPSFDSGSWSVPNTGPAMVHQAEIIVPRASADAIRSGDAVLGAGGLSGNQGGVAIGDIYVDARGATDPRAVGEATKQAVMDTVTIGFRDDSKRYVGARRR